ncbi:carbohydrate ABC transporter permease [Jiella sonneratiae]|uniref:Sugar ABC transporter permease n=1 Tax=Jiella sonneratiae TaxID=2816856 RepID=A0ABS3J593_9HYPH|nr:sugar ABC transporter permease [Jiella sonneratiae]MBO0904844.1 sugar ABC transporter permease [Jiella sonneratiae]
MNLPSETRTGLPAAGPGSAARTRSRAGRRRRRAGDRWFRWALLLPALVVLLVLTVWPVANLVRMAVSTIEFGREGAEFTFTPLRNLSRLAGDELFLTNLWTTALFVVVSVAIEMALGFLLALMVAGVPRAKGLVRTMMILPVLVPPVAIGSMWKLMYNYDFGILNQALGLIGLGPIGWLSEPSLALWSVVLVDVWHWTPFVFLILFAGVEGLPREVIEAARVDGATTAQIVRKIIVPLMAPAIAVAFIFRSILAFKVFDQIYLLTSGGPGTSTEVVSLRLYHVFFGQNELGYGALLSLVIIAAIVAFLVTTRGLVGRFAR